MIRPMAVLGFSVLGALAVCGLLGVSSAFYVMCAALLLLVISLVSKRLRENKYATAISLSISLACICFITVFFFQVQPIVELDHKTAVMTATVMDYPTRRDGNYEYTLKTEQVLLEGAPQEFRVLYTSKTDLGAKPGDRLTFRPTFYSFSSDWDKGSRFYAKGIYIGCYTRGEAELTPGNKKPLLYPILQMRQQLKLVIDARAPKETAPLLKAMLLGDKSGLSAEQLEAYRSSGVAHLFSVSGLHLAIWSSFILYVLRAFHVRRRAKYIGAMSAILFYMALTGFSFSVVRAGIMLLLYFTSHLIWRDADSLNSLGTAVFFLCCTSPFVGMDVGLLLSFTATLGILTLGRFWNEKIKKASMKRCFSVERKTIKGILTSLSISTSAVIFTFPVQLLFFDTFSLFSPITNLLIVIPGTFFLILGGLISFLSLVAKLGPMCGLLYKIINPVSQYMDWVTHGIARLRGTEIAIHTLPVLLWTGCVILLFTGAYFLRKKKKLYSAATCFSALLLILVIALQLFGARTPKITVCDVGTGTSILLTYGGRGALIGCGGDDYADRRIRQQLIRQNIDGLDLVLLPRTTQGETSAFAKLSESVRVSALVCPKTKEEQAYTVESSIDVRQQNEGTLELWGRFFIEQKESCVYLTVANVSILVLTKPTIALKDIPVSWRNADILITKELPKHAMAGCRPQDIIFSSSKAQQGIYASGGQTSSVYTTAGKGAISIEWKKESAYKIRREWN